MLVGCCANYNLAPNASKTKKLIIDFRRRPSNLQPIYINKKCVKNISNFVFEFAHKHRPQMELYSLEENPTMPLLSEDSWKN